MIKQLTLEDIAKLRNETKDPILLAILNDAEWKLGEGREIEWHYPDPIPPRPWKPFHAGNTPGFTAADGVNIGLDSYGALSHSDKSVLAQFIVDRVNAGESNPWIEIEAEYKKTFAQAHAILDAMEVPKANRVECNRPDCNSLLIHRLHHVQDNFTTHSAECNAVFAKTVVSALQILDEIGVPPVKDAKAIAPLLDRLRMLQRSLSVKHCHIVAPIQPSENQYVPIQHVLDTLCSVCTTVMKDALQWQDSADCFCGQNTGRPEDFRFSSVVLQFIEDAVKEKIERFKANASLP